MKKIETSANGEPTNEPALSNVLVETIGNRIKIRTAICSGVLSFGITQEEADELVAAGQARIVGSF